jgi:FkbM family methyltransferase
VLRDAGRTSIDDLLTDLPPVRPSGPIRRAAHGARALHRFRRKEFRRRVRFYAQFIARGDLCFDVGANIGSRVAAFHAIGARVVAVEPQEGCVAELLRRFGWSRRVAVVPVGLAESEGVRPLWIAEFDPISSMSPEWLDAVRTTGRFGEESWAHQREVRVTTLDRLVDAFGEPSFCKIDVEGSELAVLQGLSRPIRALSFEFTPECIELTTACIERLSELGDYEYNYSNGESMTMALSDWADPRAIRPVLAALPGPPLFGDVYARLRPAREVAG